MIQIGLAKRLINLDTTPPHITVAFLPCRPDPVFLTALVLAGCSSVPQEGATEGSEVELKRHEPHCLPKGRERKIGHCSHLPSGF